MAYREIFGRGEASGVALGEAQGEAKVTLRQLSRRCGPLSAEQERLIRSLPLEQPARGLITRPGPSRAGCHQEGAGASLDSLASGRHSQELRQRASPHRAPAAFAPILARLRGPGGVIAFVSQSLETPKIMRLCS